MACKLSAVLALFGLWLVTPACPRPPTFLVDVVGDVPAPGLYALPQPEQRLALARAGAPMLAAGPLTPGDTLVVVGNRATIEAPADPPLVGRAIDLNRARASALATTPGIGPARAAALVAYRDRHGPFYTLDEAVRVRGIGPVALAGARPWWTVEDRGPRPPPPPMDLNGASLARLQGLPRVGPVLAARLVAHRPYRDLHDVLRVPGIGRATLDRWRGRVTVAAARDRGPS